MLGKLNAVILAITPHMSEATSRMMDKIGLVTIGVAAVNGAATPLIDPHAGFWLAASHIIMVISGTGGVLFVVKQVVDMYYSWKRNLREIELRAEQRDMAEVTKQRILQNKDEL